MVMTSDETQIQIFTFVYFVAKIVVLNGGHVMPL